MGQYNQNVDILIGCNKEEGLKFTTDAYLDNTLIDTWREQWLDWTNSTNPPGPLPGGRGYTYMLGLDKNDSVASNRLLAINEKYLGSLENMIFENIENITNMYTDAWYCYSGHDFITRHISNVKENNTFQYVYTHKGEFSPLGVSHGDEIPLQFFPYRNQEYDPDEPDIITTKEDKEMSDLFIELWKNFVKNGKPNEKNITNVNWEAIWDINDRHYLNLNLIATMEDLSGEFEERMNFWDNLMNGMFDN